MIINDNSDRYRCGSAFEQKTISIPTRSRKNVVAKLREKGVKLATAESCTGGLLSERITAVSGASEVFDLAYAHMQMK